MKKAKRKKQSVPLLGLTKDIAELFGVFSRIFRELDLTAEESKRLSDEKNQLAVKWKKIILETLDSAAETPKSDFLDERRIDEMALTAAKGFFSEEDFGGSNFKPVVPEKPIAEIEKKFGDDNGGNVVLNNETPIVLAGKYPDLIEKISSFYYEVFEEKVDFSNVKIPEKNVSPLFDAEPGYWYYQRLLIRAKSMVLSKIFSGFEKFPHVYVGFSDDLLAMLGVETKKLRKYDLSAIYKEKVIPALDDIVRSARNAEEDYAFWVCDDLISDKECVDISANKLNMEKLPTLSLEERVLHELFTLWLKGKGYYGKDDVTICADSRFVFPDEQETVPKFGWYESNIVVSWHSPSKIAPNIRAHRVIVF